MDGAEHKKRRALRGGWYPAPRKVTLEAQGHLFRLKVPLSAPLGGGGARGDIREFSASSRKRMLETMARIDAERAGFIAFVTLTYPDREGELPPLTGPPGMLESGWFEQVYRLSSSW